MTDEHAILMLEYGQLLKIFTHLDETDKPAGPLMLRSAILHILKRLGPPTADEAADIDEA